MPNNKKRKLRSLTILLWICIAIIYSVFPGAVSAASGITNISTNVGDYSNNQVPQYEKFEVSFQVSGSVAKNSFYPYSPSLPAGMNASTDAGISITAYFTSPSGETFQQPGFYYQGFDDQMIGDKSWFYPNNNDSWKVRFSPNEVGNWQYYLKAQDSGGVIQTSIQSFFVTESESKGFVKKSDKDARYFEFDNGSYFSATGFNGALNHVDPNKNIEIFKAMGENGISLIRGWLMQHSIFGSAWGFWYSFNPVFQTQEPIILLAHPKDARLTKYAGLTPPNAIPGHDVYLWLNFDKTTTGTGQYSFNPCQVLGWEPRSAKVPLKPNTNYRVKARYNTQLMEGPAVAGKPFGFAIKSGGWLWNGTDETQRCYNTNKGTVLAASYAGSTWTNTPDTQNPGWTITEGTFNSQGQNFIDHLYLTLDNVSSTDSDPKGGHAFIDEVAIEEVLGNGQYGPNLVFKPVMGMHTYINQRDALALDKTVDIAHQNNVYIKGVLNEKNDFILQSFNFDGTMAATKDSALFYGNGRETANKTKVRFLQEAWWRYAQARWGYSPNIQSWELLNEGPDGMTNHHILTDEFGKFMHCRVFGVSSGADCEYDHPNDHLITTSFSNGKFPVLFWKNSSGAYPDVDFADIHLYAFEATSANFNDEAAFSKDQSMTVANQQLGKPVIRGETGWQFGATDWFGENATDGLWLHNFLWAGLNSGGLIEHYWNGPPTQNHIVKTTTQGIVAHDHRPEYLKVKNFIADIPLNNGHYEEAGATVTGSSDLRAWGQKDLTNGRAHLWIQNAKHTWKNVNDGVSIAPITATVAIGGFTAGKSYEVAWWDTYAAQVSSTQSVTANASGTLQLQINGLSNDLAVKIGDYSTAVCIPPSLLGDIDLSGKVTVLDLTALIGHFGSDNQAGDLNCDSVVNLKDVSILLGNLGTY